MRAALAVVLVLHGLIHLMGFAKAFGLAKLPQLTQPISRSAGLLWLVTGIGIAVVAFLPWRLFWIVGLPAVVLSQALILGSWSDAKFGTVANVILLAAVAYAFASRGPLSLPAEYEADVRRELGGAKRARVIVTESDLERLPEPVRAWLRAIGVVGRPRPTNVRARMRGRIRDTDTSPWMEFTAEQLNTDGPSPSRLFLMDAKMKGLPVDVYHRFVGEPATFRVRLASIVTIIDAKGPVMNRGETVTIFNDLCFLAPGTLVDPAIRWEPIDATSARAIYTRGRETISAVLRFDASGMLVDFVSDDRSRASSDGRSFTPVRWSTPLREPRHFGALLLPSRGEARWHLPDGTSYAYIEVDLLDVAYDVAAAGPAWSPLSP
jgi:hypothetical protein